MSKTKKEKVINEKLADSIKRYTTYWSSFGANWAAALYLAFIKKYGEEAKQVAYDALKEHGRRFGEQISRTAKKRDLEAYDEIFLKPFYVVPGVGALPTICYYSNTPSKLEFEATWCPVHESWKMMGLRPEDMAEVAKLFCVAPDVGLQEVWNPKIKLKGPQEIKPRGDKRCYWCHEIE